MVENFYVVRFYVRSDNISIKKAILHNSVYLKDAIGLIETTVLI